MSIKELYGSFIYAQQACHPDHEDGLVASGPTTLPGYPARQRLGPPRHRLMGRLSALTEGSKGSYLPTHDAGAVTIILWDKPIHNDKERSKLPV